MAKKPLVKKKLGGEDPKLKQAVKDSTRASNYYNNSYNKALKDPNGKPPSEQNYDAYQRAINKPAEIRKAMSVKKMGGSVKTKRKK
jgi:hypothetical protein